MYWSFFWKKNFWSWQLQKFFLWRKPSWTWPRYRMCGTWPKSASKVNFDFWGHQGIFRPFFDPRESKNTSEKVNRQTMTTQKCHQKKLGIFGYLKKLKSQLCDKNSQRYLKILLVVFFVPSRYLWHLNRNHNL